VFGRATIRLGIGPHSSLLFICSVYEATHVNLNHCHCHFSRSCVVQYRLRCVIGEYCIGSSTADYTETLLPRGVLGGQWPSLIHLMKIGTSVRDMIPAMKTQH